MKKSRLPFDVEFLLESVLKETPDIVRLYKGDDFDASATRLNRSGARVPKNGVQLGWEAVGACAFFFDSANSVAMYSNRLTHDDMETLLTNAAMDATLYPNSVGLKYSVYKDDIGNISIKNIDETSDALDAPVRIPDPFGPPACISVGFIGLPKKNSEKESVFTYLRENHVYFRALDIRGYKNGNHKIISGRVWRRQNIISFWEKRKQVMDRFHLVEILLTGLKLDKTEMAYEFIDGNGSIFSYNELGVPYAKDKLSPDEERKLRAVQHIDPKAKKKLSGDEFSKLHAKKIAKGFDYPVLATASIPALERRIKLKDLVDERLDAKDKKYKT